MLMANELICALLNLFALGLDVADDDVHRQAGHLEAGGAWEGPGADGLHEREVQAPSAVRTGSGNPRNGIRTCRQFIGSIICRYWKSPQLYRQAGSCRQSRLPSPGWDGTDHAGRDNDNDRPGPAAPHSESVARVTGVLQDQFIFQFSARFLQFCIS